MNIKHSRRVTKTTRLSDETVLGRAANLMLDTNHLYHYAATEFFLAQL